MIDRLIHPTMTPDQFREPRWARFLFASTAAAWLWLVIRLYMAYVFIPAGWGKITSGKWLFGDGSPIQGLVGKAVEADGTPGWYVWFLQNVVEPNAGLFATLVALGEFAAGLGLLVGLITGVAAFGAVFLNANFILAGSLGSNPALVMMGLLLVVAWRNAGGSASTGGSSPGPTGRCSRPSPRNPVDQLELRLASVRLAPPGVAQRRLASRSGYSDALSGPDMGAPRVVWSIRLPEYRRHVSLCAPQWHAPRGARSPSTP